VILMNSISRNNRLGSVLHRLKSISALHTCTSTARYTIQIIELIRPFKALSRSRSRPLFTGFRGVDLISSKSQHLRTATQQNLSPRTIHEQLITTIFATKIIAQVRTITYIESKEITGNYSSFINVGDRKYVLHHRIRR